VHILLGQTAGNAGPHSVTEGKDQIGIEGTTVLEPSIWLEAQGILEVLLQPTGYHVLGNHGGLARDNTI